MSIKIRQLKEIYSKYERWLIPGALIFGVIVDVLTFKSIEIETAFLILGGHVVIAGASIALLNVANKEGQWRTKADMIAPLALQFSFGALLSASLIFYWFSGAFSVSWPILGMIALLMTSNEVLRHYYLKPVIQLSVFSFILFSLGTLVLPFLFNSIDVAMFVLAGIGSLVLTALFVWMLSRLSSEVRQLRRQIAIGVLSVFALMNAFYFFNLIPPIPLSLRDAGVYHEVRRTDMRYLLTEEESDWIDRLLPGQTIHLKKGERVFVFTSIFAPAKLNTTVYHRWQHFDDNQGKWIDRDVLSFGMTGGRDEGYRGFSSKSSVAEGKWRVNVETERGQVIGRVGFTIEFVESSPRLVPTSR